MGASCRSGGRSCFRARGRLRCRRARGDLVCASVLGCTCLLGRRRPGRLRPVALASRSASRRSASRRAAGHTPGKRRRRGLRGRGLGHDERRGARVSFGRVARSQQSSPRRLGRPARRCPPIVRNWRPLGRSFRAMRAREGVVGCCWRRASRFWHTHGVGSSGPALERGQQPAPPSTQGVSKSVATGAVLRPGSCTLST